MTAERNDPTQAGFTPPASGAIRLSGNEVAALCLKAARGGGLPWGLAEEAGFAASWLSARGLDGPGALLARLDAMPALPAQLVDGVFRQPDKAPLCPVVLGAALSDFAALTPDGVRAEPVCRPVLTLAFLHQIAQAVGARMRLDWNTGHVTVSEAGEIAGDLAALAALQTARIAVSPDTGPSAQAGPARGAATTTPQTLARLNAYAMRTTVPASAASRADAGSMDDDND